MKQQFNPDLLKSFIHIAEEGSFLRAAHRVGRTQSAVSMQIQRLEQLVGHALFTRERPLVRLTRKGEKMLDYARRILQLQNEAWEAISENEPQGLVRFGIPDDYASGILPRILERFSEHDAHIEVEVHCGTSTILTEKINRGELDLALISHQPNSPSGKIIGHEKLVWAASPKHAAHRRDPISLAVFQEDCLIRRSAVAALSKSGFRHRIAYSSPNLAALLAVTSSGLAIAAMPRSSVPPTLQILNAKDGFPKLPTLDLALITHKETISGAVQVFADCIENSL
ncbi:MAG: LysR family transcriptional regulator [Sneathiella sp.]|nr:LysR family transcriptional regulator [Sneathiella sp.]